MEDPKSWVPTKWVRNPRLVERLRAIVGLRLKINEPMSRHTSFKIGGPADFFVEIESEAELKDVLELIRDHNLPGFILGGGTNLLVRDGGIRGLTLRPTGFFNKIDIRGRDKGERRNEKSEIIKVGAGVSLPRLSREAATAGLSGLEFTAGIPGRIGGAVKLNASAFGKSIGELIKWVRVASPAGEEKLILAEDINFTYRHGLKEGIVLEVGLELSYGEPSKIKRQMHELLARKKAAQPLSGRNAGCIFLNPPGNYAGALIEKAGLKGSCVGQAKVSDKHANFIQNIGKATAADVLKLIKIIKSRVKDYSGIDLDLEITVVGEEGLGDQRQEAVI
ncbi:MAG: UDP-N-acetylmuramate dehydrogenase [bacterium]